MQLFNKNKTNDEGERSAGPMPLFQQLSVQNHNKEEDRKRISREVKKEVNKNIKSFKDSLENLDKDNTSP
jgi:signal transduction histidine kinase